MPHLVSTPPGPGLDTWFPAAPMVPAPFPRPRTVVAGISVAKTLAMVATVASIAMAATPSRADMPALSRDFRTERYVVERPQLASLRSRRWAELSLSAGLFQRGETGGAWTGGPWSRVGGGEADGRLVWGQFSLGGSAVSDTKREVDDREFARRVFVMLYAPETHLSITLARGLESDRGGWDLELETLALRWKAVQNKVSWFPRVWLWNRVRTLDESSTPVLTPAVGIYHQHTIVIGSAVYLGAAVFDEVADERLPHPRLLFQFGYATNPTPLFGGDPNAPPVPGTREPSKVSRSFYAGLGYEAPLSTRDQARLVAQIGTHFVRPH